LPGIVTTGQRHWTLVGGLPKTAQLPVSRWYEQIGDPTLADGILDRLVHNAHLLRGE
jgi:hypothetical protein